MRAFLKSYHEHLNYNAVFAASLATAVVLIALVK